jgi:hypothetical protein
MSVSTRSQISVQPNERQEASRLSRKHKAYEAIAKMKTKQNSKVGGRKWRQPYNTAASALI